MKTYNQFLNTPFSEEVTPPEPQEEDPSIKSKEKRQMQIKKQVLLKKMQAVRAGAGADIVASHTPEGEMVEDYYRGTGEKVQKRTKKWMDKKGMKGAPGLDAMKAREAEHRAKRGVKEEVVDEAKVDKGRSDYGKASIRNYRRKGPGHGEPAMFDPENKRGKLIDKRREEHKARRGVKGAKVPAYKVNEDKALELVRANIIKKHGKGAIYDPKNVKKPSEADKAKAAAERKKRQDADNKAYAARAKKAGFKSTQDYTNVVARYGSEDNYKKGRGLGT